MASYKVYTLAQLSEEIPSVKILRMSDVDNIEALENALNDIHKWAIANNMEFHQLLHAGGTKVIFKY